MSPTLQDSLYRDDGQLSSVAAPEAEDVESLKREILLLEAHLRGTSASCPEDDSREREVLALEEELRQSYLDYAMSVVVGRALPDDAVSYIDRCHRAITGAFAQLELLGKYSHRIAANRRAAMFAVFIILAHCQRAHAAQALKLQKASESACFRNPLSEYGPELSEYRHRHR